MYPSFNIQNVTFNTILLYKLVAVLYFVCFGLYVLFSRQPDYLDGEFTPATIHFTADSMGKVQPMAVFTFTRTDTVKVPAGYVFRSLKEGQRVQVIYEAARPQHAQVYAWWGYWFTWGECLASVILLLALFQIAVQVTNKPTPEALLEEQAMSQPQYKRKYKE